MLEQASQEDFSLPLKHQMEKKTSLGGDRGHLDDFKSSHETLWSCDH